MLNSSQIVRLLGCSLLVLSGCRPVGPDHERPVLGLPASFSRGGMEWKRHTEPCAPVRRAWWKLYADGVLTSLVERALAGNQEIAASAARLRQARELSQVVRSAYFPQIDLGRQVSRSKTRRPGSGGVSIVESRFVVPVDFSYEVDMWGKLRRQVESASATAEAADDGHQAQRLSVAGEVAQTYWALRAVDADRAVLTRTLEIRRKALDLLTKSQAAGSISGLDLARATTEVASVEAARIRLDQDRMELVNALAVLVGVPATGFSVPENHELPAPPSVPVSLPSELLRQRPDIRAAERRVAAANADIGVATAAFYPSFSINASSGLSAAAMGDLFQASSLIWSIGSNTTLPITQGKRFQSQKRAAEAAHAAASADYRQTVLTSVGEVETALQGASLLERRQLAQDQALAAARKTLDLSMKRFQSGLVSFLDMVDAERTRLEAEKAANAIRAERLALSVSLIKALGGEW